MEIGARLHHLQLLSPDPEGCARFYGRVYGMRVDAQSAAWSCQGRERRLLFAAGPANRLGFAALSFADRAALEAYRRRVEAHVPVVASRSPCFESEVFSVSDPDGNRLLFGVAAEAALAPETDRTDAPVRAARLQHFAVRSRQTPALLAFYRDVLGFAVSDRVEDQSARLRACFLRSDPEHHVLAIFEASQQRHDHLSFETTDWAALRDWADRMSMLQVPMVWGVGRHGPGNDVFFMVRDPDGNLVEISAELEVCSPTRSERLWPHEERTLNLWGAAIMRS